MLQNDSFCSKRTTVLEPSSTLNNNRINGKLKFTHEKRPFFFFWLNSLKLNPRYLQSILLTFNPIISLNILTNRGWKLRFTVNSDLCRLIFLSREKTRVFRISLILLAFFNIGSKKNKNIMSQRKDERLPYLAYKVWCHEWYHHHVLWLQPKRERCDSKEKGLRDTTIHKNLKRKEKKLLT